MNIPMRTNLFIVIDKICHGTASIREAQLEHIWRLNRMRMHANLLSRRQVEFLIYELFDLVTMNRRPAYSQQDKSLYDSYILQRREFDESLLAGHGRLPNVLTLVLSPYALTGANSIDRPQFESASGLAYSQYLFAESAYTFFLFGLQLLDDYRTAVKPGSRQNADQLLVFLTPVLRTFAQHYEMWWAELERGLGLDALPPKTPTLSSYIEKSLLTHLQQFSVEDPIEDKLFDWRKRYFHGYSQLLAMIDESIDDARKRPRLLGVANQLENLVGALETYLAVTLRNAGRGRVFDATVHNTGFNESVGTIVIAWLWLRQGLVADEAMSTSLGWGESLFYIQKIKTMDSYFQTEVANLKL